MQSIKKNSKIQNNTAPNVEKDWLFYVAQPYTYNPEEAYRYAVYYRNALVNLGVFSYCPICETHTPHKDYVELMTNNWNDEQEMKIFKDSLYEFYVEEDLMKAKLMHDGSTPKCKFAMLMGIGWNLKFPAKDPSHKGELLFDLYHMYKDYLNVSVMPISMGCLKEYFWAMQQGIPVYDLGHFLDTFQLKHVQLDIVEDQVSFWKDAGNMGLKYQ